MTKLILFFITISYAQTLNQPSSLVLTDVLLSRNFSRSHVSFGGGSIGGFGGGDTTDLRRLAAWFYGERQIQVCTQLNVNFGLNEITISDAVQKAILLWKAYFSEKQINSNLSEKINLNFKLKPKCTGGEDLVFYFGTGPINQNLLDLRAFQSLSNPLAYVNKTHMSEDLKWSKGYIRFVESNSYGLDDGFFPDWSNQQHFFQILVHEIGHVLGFTHIPGTIMTGSIVRDTVVENKALNVDNDVELFSCKSCLASFDLETTNDQGLFPLSSKIHFENDRVHFENEFGVEVVTPISIIKKDHRLNLVSIFESEELMLNLNHIYFLNYLNKNLVFIHEGSSLKIIKDGIPVAEFNQRFAL